jgi:biopolymer transport protein ExbD
VAEAKEALQASLKEETQKLTLLKPNDPSAREITVMADKGLPYSMLKKIMMTATAADIGKMSLAVIEKEQAYRGPNPG